MDDAATADARPAVSTVNTRAAKYRPLLTDAARPATFTVRAVDENGAARDTPIAGEHPLTLYVDKQELLTLMTLGGAPEALAIGYLRNQRLVHSIEDIVSVQVDWETNSVAVKTRNGLADLDAKTAKRTKTTGCGQGTVFGAMMDGLQSAQLPDAQSARISQSMLRDILEVMRQQDSIHRKAGSVHGCALFRGTEKLMFIEDVGRHNAIDTIAGWMWMHGVHGADKVFYTTGRLTSEMVMKSAQIGVPIIVSRNGVTAMGHEMAERLGMTSFGRASNRHFICYTGFERFDSEPEPQRAPVRVVSG